MNGTYHILYKQYSPGRTCCISNLTSSQLVRDIWLDPSRYNTTPPPISILCNGAPLLFLSSDGREDLHSSCDVSASFFVVNVVAICGADKDEPVFAVTKENSGNDIHSNDAMRMRGRAIVYNSWGNDLQK